MRDLVDVLVVSGPLLDLDSVNSTTMRDARFFSEWLEQGPRSSLTSMAKRGSHAYESVVFDAFERAFTATPEDGEERSSLERMADAMPARLPIIVEPRVPIGGGRSIVTRLDSPLNPLGSAILTGLEQVPDELLERVAFVPMGAFTEYYVPRRDDELVLHDPFSDRVVRRGSRSAIRSLMRSVDRAAFFADSLDEVVFPGYLFDASSAAAWGGDRASLQIAGYVGEAIASRRLAHVLESSWRTLDGRLGFDGLPVFARSSDSVERTLRRALHDVERFERVRIPKAARSTSLLAGASDLGMLDPRVQGRLVSIIGSLDSSVTLERRVDPRSEPVARAYGIDLVLEPWSRIVERSIEQPTPIVDLDGDVVGIGSLSDRIVPISSLASSERVFSLFVEGKGASDVSASDIGLGLCSLRHYVRPLPNPDRESLRDASIAIHKALSLPPLDPLGSYRFSPGSFSELPFVSDRGVRIGYRPDFAGLIETEGSYDLFIADAKASRFSARMKEGHRDQLLVYGSLLGSDLRDAGVPIGSVHALVYSLPERGVSDVFEPSARMVFDPDDGFAIGRVSFLAELPRRLEGLEDAGVRLRTKAVSQARGLCDVCREAYSGRYQACSQLMKDSS